jgi:hypothetical protein
LVPDPADGLQLNPSLCQANTAIIALRESDEHAPFDLLTADGTLTGRLLPVCASLRDGRIRKMIKRAEENVLCVSSNSADVVLLLAQNVPATFDTGLTQLGDDYLVQVRKDYKLDPPEPERNYGIIEMEDCDPDDEQVLPDILFLGWSPATLSAELPPGFSAIVSHLTAIEHHLGLYMDRFCQWRPTQVEISQIEFCLEVRMLKELKGAIIESIRNSSGQLISSPANPEESPKNLAEAIKALERLRSREPRDKEAERRVWQKFHALIKKSAIRPLFAAMEATNDPIERSYWLMAAMNAQLLYPQYSRLMLRRPTGSRWPGKLVTYPDDKFRQMMQITDRQRQILKDIITYRKDSYRIWK